MMRSLFAGVSGLRNHQTRMDVIGNNIANVNTVGFKASRVNFQDVLSQTLSGASGASGARGGTNPMQIGLGMGLASVDTIFTDGSFQPTGKQTDLSIKGSGFFVLSADGGATQVYTRAGNFDFDSQGNFLVPGTGYKVMGWMGSGGTINTSGNVTPLKVPTGAGMDAKVTSNVIFAKNLSSEALTGDTQLASINIYDGQGTAHKLTGTFAKTATPNQWTFTLPATAVAGATIPATTITLNFDAATGAFINPSAPAAYVPPTLTVTPTTGASAFTTTLNFSQLTQNGAATSAVIDDQNGYTAGTLESTTIDPNGVIYGIFSNGQSQMMAQVALATFNNPAGLTKAGESLYVRSNNSGEPFVGTTGTGGRGTLSPGTLEMANVDLAQEFSNMIITQRGFQANSKIISVTDEMLQELANLKR
jgi:flagellar hook protein FlgE